MLCNNYIIIIIGIIFSHFRIVSEMDSDFDERGARSSNERVRLKCSYDDCCSCCQDPNCVDSEWIDG